MDHEKKLLELIGVTTFKEYTEPRTAEELIQCGKYCMEIHDKITVQGELQKEQIHSEFAWLLAEILQPPAREKYGMAGAVAIKQLLTESWNATGKADFERQINLCHTAFRQIGLNQEQEKALFERMEILPDLLIDILATEAARLQLIPFENINEITRVLAGMFMEANHADPSRNN